MCPCRMCEVKANDITHNLKLENELFNPLHSF